MKLKPRNLVLFITLCITFLSLTACTVSQVPIGNPEIPYPPIEPPAVGGIFHPATGTIVSQETMLSVLNDNRIVYVGETHDNPASHRLQLDVLKSLYERYPGKISIGMEMFTPAQQASLDRWSAGELDEKTFLKEVEWYTVWKGDFDLYRDLLLFARDNRIPVIGLNANKKMVRAVGRKPLDELTPEEQAEIPELDLSDPYHSAMVKAIYGDHVKSEGRLAGFQRVQALWDETMATSIVAYLQSPQGEDQKMLVLAGGNHVRHGFGIPRRVFKKLPVSYIMVGSKEIEIPESRKAQLMDVNMPLFPMTAYDFITFTRYEEVPNKKVMLGVQFEEVEDATGLKVMAVVPESAAALAGLKENDIMLAFDGEQLNDSFDLVYLIQQKRAGDTGVIIVLRQDRKINLNVTFDENKGHGNN